MMMTLKYIVLALIFSFIFFHFIKYSVGEMMKKGKFNVVNKRETKRSGKDEKMSQLTL